MKELRFEILPEEMKGIMVAGYSLRNIPDEQPKKRSYKKHYISFFITAALVWLGLTGFENGASWLLIPFAIWEALFIFANVRPRKRGNANEVLAK